MRLPIIDAFAPLASESQTSLETPRKNDRPEFTTAIYFHELATTDELVHVDSVVHA